MGIRISQHASPWVVVVVGGKVAAPDDGVAGRSLSASSQLSKQYQYVAVLSRVSHFARIAWTTTITTRDVSSGGTLSLTARDSKERVLERPQRLYERCGRP
jgi:hypothetical protein